MPVYDYKCACGNTFECRQTFESEPFAKCSKCGKMAHRQLHCAPIIFKGSGFYITDHRKDDGGEKAKKAEKAEKEETAAKTETKAEKSEPKAEKKTEKKTDKAEKVSAKKD